MPRVNMEERALEIYVDDTFITLYGNASCQKVIDLGCYEEGDEITLMIKTDGKKVPAEPVVVPEDLQHLRM